MKIDRFNYIVVKIETYYRISGKLKNDEVFQETVKLDI